MQDKYLDAVVVARRPLTERIAEFLIAPQQAGPLPIAEAGSHLVAGRAESDAAAAQIRGAATGWHARIPATLVPRSQTLLQERLHHRDCRMQLPAAQFSFARFRTGDVANVDLAIPHRTIEQLARVSHHAADHDHQVALPWLGYHFAHQEFAPLL